MPVLMAGEGGRDPGTGELSTPDTTRWLGMFMPALVLRLATLSS